MTVVLCLFQHEMIHALLFVAENNRDHDGHGPQFQAHMTRINAKTGANITIYHNFHNEVRQYRQHWWKCTGPCQHRPPFYGMVKRSMNRAPSSMDLWWDTHKQTCGGEFLKVKEPDGYKDKRKRKLERKAGKESMSQDNQSQPKLLKDKDRLGNIERYFEKLPSLGHRLGSCSDKSSSSTAVLHCDQTEEGDGEHTNGDGHFTTDNRHSGNTSSAETNSDQQNARFGFVSPNSHSSCICPVCSQQVLLSNVNAHLDSCLASSNTDNCT